jgi:hypothetical protein
MITEKELKEIEEIKLDVKKHKCKTCGKQALHAWDGKMWADKKLTDMREYYCEECWIKAMQESGGW